MKFSEEDKKFVKSQLTGAILLHGLPTMRSMMPNKIKSVVFENNNVVLVFGRINKLSVTNEIAMKLAEQGIAQFKDENKEMHNLAIEGFEAKIDEIEDSIEEEITEESDEYSLMEKSKEKFDNLSNDDLRKAYREALNGYESSIKESGEGDESIGMDMFVIEQIMEERGIPFHKDERTPPEIAKENYSKLTNEELVTAYKQHLKSWDREEGYHQMEIQVMEEIMNDRNIPIPVVVEADTVDNKFIESVILALHHNQDKNGTDVQVLMLLKPFGITLDDWYDIKIKKYDFLSNFTEEHKESMIESLNDYVKEQHESEEFKAFSEKDRNIIGSSIAMCIKAKYFEDDKQAKQLLSKLGMYETLF